jgi:uncharacterized protein YdeI (YjbR/CyaY-like superfamily)
MDTGTRNPSVDDFLLGEKKWPAELLYLRGIALESGLTETIKWGKPCYMLENANVALLFSFKNACAIGFLKGALLRDEQKLLAAPGEHSQAMRMLKFTSFQEIAAQEQFIRAYIREAIELERSGAEIVFTEHETLEPPEELKEKFRSMPELEAAFLQLTPGRQRVYLMYFSQAKQSETRVSRIEKYVPLILRGKGLNDR